MHSLNEPITRYTRSDIPILEQDLTVGQALERIRREGLGQKIVYFYAINGQQQLVGVIPTRRLLTSPLETRIRDVMISNVIALPNTATVFDAAEFFVLHKFMALPVVDQEQHVLGVVDVTLFTEEVYDLAERQQVDDVFQLIGMRLSEIKSLSSIAVFRYRFRWLLATLASGLLCAVLTSLFEDVLVKAVVFAFFLPMALGLAESVSMQSMTIILQLLHATQATWREYAARMRREVLPAVLLGLSCGATVALIGWLWRGQFGPAAAIGGSLACSIAVACLLGISVPMALHALKWDPKIAAGPLTLALTDLATVTFYFSAALLVV